MPRSTIFTMRDSAEWAAAEPGKGMVESRHSVYDVPTSVARIKQHSGINAVSHAHTFLYVSLESNCRLRVAKPSGSHVYQPGAKGQENI